MEKRGLSHLEVIFSVIIFVGAVSVALFFFNPASSYKSGEPSYDYIAKAIEENLTINVTIYGVEVDNSGGGDKDSVTINKKIEDGKIGVKIIDSNGNNIPYMVSNKEDGTIIWGTSLDFVYIIVGEDIPFIEDNGLGAGSQNDRIVSLNTKKVVSETRAKGLKADYDANYYALKKFFGISDNINFGFELMGIKAERTPLPQQVSIVSKTKRVEVLKENNNKFEFATLRVKIW